MVTVAPITIARRRVPVDKRHVDAERTDHRCTAAIYWAIMGCVVSIMLVIVALVGASVTRSRYYEGWIDIALAVGCTLIPMCVAWAITSMVLVSCTHARWPVPWYQRLTHMATDEELAAVYQWA